MQLKDEERRVESLLTRKILHVKGGLTVIVVPLTSFMQTSLRRHRFAIILLNVIYTSNLTSFTHHLKDEDACV